MSSIYKEVIISFMLFIFVYEVFSKSTAEIKFRVTTYDAHGKKLNDSTLDYKHKFPKSDKEEFSHHYTYHFGSDGELHKHTFSGGEGTSNDVMMEDQMGEQSENQDDNQNDNNEENDQDNETENDNDQ